MEGIVSISRLHAKTSINLNIPGCFLQVDKKQDNSHCRKVPIQTAVACMHNQFLICERLRSIKVL